MKLQLQQMLLRELLIARGVVLIGGILILMIFHPLLLLVIVYPLLMGILLVVITRWILLVLGMFLFLELALRQHRQLW